MIATCAAWRYTARYYARPHNRVIKKARHHRARNKYRTLRCDSCRRGIIHLHPSLYLSMHDNQRDLNRPRSLRASSGASSSSSTSIWMTGANRENQGHHAQRPELRSTSALRKRVRWPQTGNEAVRNERFRPDPFVGLAGLESVPSRNHGC